MPVCEARIAPMSETQRFVPRNLAKEIPLW